MNEFWFSYELTAAKYRPGFQCYPLFGRVHLLELAISALFIVCMAAWYRRAGTRTRRRILVGVTAALLADEAALPLPMVFAVLAAVTATLCVPRSPVSSIIYISLLVRRTAQF